MIIQTDAIINPWAVMIEPLHALVADAAMARTICPNDFTVRAQEYWVENFHQFHKVDLFRSFEVARVSAERDEM